MVNPARHMVPRPPRDLASDWPRSRRRPLVGPPRPGRRAESWLYTRSQKGREVMTGTWWADGGRGSQTEQYSFSGEVRMGAEGIVAKQYPGPPLCHRVLTKADQARKEWPQKGAKNQSVGVALPRAYSACTVSFACDFLRLFSAKKFGDRSVALRRSSLEAQLPEWWVNTRCPTAVAARRDPLPGG